MTSFNYWLIENENTSFLERAIGTNLDVEIYLQDNPHLCNPQVTEYDDLFEDCIDLWHENNYSEAK